MNRKEVIVQKIRRETVPAGDTPVIRHPGVFIKRLLLAVTVMMILTFPVLAQGADVAVIFSPRYGQTEARAMLDMINQFRTGSDAWYWNSDNKTKTVCNLSPLTYDYALERVAMQRAAEIALYFDYDRPNGKTYSTALSEAGYSWSYSGENIAGGYDSAEEVFLGWREDNDLYEDQAHRRDMLSSLYNRVGIAHIVVDGCHYWVQEFASSSTSSSSTAAVDYVQNMIVSVSDSKITSFTGQLSQSVLNIPFLESVSMPSVKWNLVTSEYWGYADSAEITFPNPPTWRIDNTGLVTLVGNSITGVKTGSTKARISALNTECVVDINVVANSFSGAAVTLSGDRFEYTGSDITPAVTSVKVNGKRLVEGTNYTVAYRNNRNAGTAYVEITGVGNYSGSVIKTFTITPINMTGCSIAPISNQVYTGSAIAPAVEVTLGTTRIPESEYSVTYEDNINTGIADLTITGQGNYVGTSTTTFQIVPRDISTGTVSGISTQTYTGSPITFSVLGLSVNGRTLARGTDYDVAYSNNTNIGTAVITFNGKGNYSGSLSKSFVITPIDLSSCQISAIPNQVYSGSAVTPDPVVTIGSILSKNRDYVVTYGNNVNAGTAELTVTGIGNYQGSKTVSFTIDPVSISTGTVSGITDYQTYTGSNIVMNQLKLTFNGVVLTEGTHYTVSYTNNRNAGTATITFSGKGNYCGSVAKTFTILPKSIQGCQIAPVSAQAFTGDPIIPSTSVTLGSALSYGTDYAVSCQNNTNVGTATLTVIGIGNYTGSASTSFMIMPRSIDGGVLSGVSMQEYAGSPVTISDPGLTVNGKKLTPGVDYETAYLNNNAIGTATIIVSGKGNYFGTLQSNFEITKYLISNCTVDTIGDQMFNGSAITPVPVVRRGGVQLTGNNYTVSYQNNTNAGTASLILTGKGDYQGTKTVNFTIRPVSIVNGSVNGIADSIVYTGVPVVQNNLSLTLNGKTLAGGSDYKVAYSGNTSVGTAKLTVTGTGNYTGSIQREFTIVPKNLKDCTVSQVSSYLYTGSAIIPALTIKSGNVQLTTADYTITGQNNTNVGTATITITGKGNYTGSVSKSFAITPRSIENSTVVSALSDQAYTGSPITIKTLLIYTNGRTLVADTDYEAVYSDNIEVGTAKITLKGKGNYCGTCLLTFKIKEGGSSEIARSVLPKGSKVTDPSSKAKYVITGYASDGTPEIQFAGTSSTKTTIKIPNTVYLKGIRCKVTSIAKSAFRNNKKIKAVSIGKYVKTIDNYAFYGCTSLQSVTGGTGLTRIGIKAFYKCTSLKSFTIPSKVKTVGKAAFYGCKNMKTLVIKSKLLTASKTGSKAFSRLYSRITVKVPSSKYNTYQQLLLSKGLSSKAVFKK